jgi:hypothetical protein
MDIHCSSTSIMRQTTVLIGSCPGDRRPAPLAHLADEVFLNLSQELERQGLSRKVEADMFGWRARLPAPCPAGAGERETDRA